MAGEIDLFQRCAIMIYVQGPRHEFCSGGAKIEIWKIKYGIQLFRPQNGLESLKFSFSTANHVHLGKLHILF